MRLWHQDLLPHLPGMQLNGQHRECCALRGLGWNRPHSTVNYVFLHNPALLSRYHIEVMKEKKRRGHAWTDYRWLDPLFRGDRSDPWDLHIFDLELFTKLEGKVYAEHDEEYLQECLMNLKVKGVRLYEWDKFRK
jgi:uncharacterized protein (TIGR02328 family)